MGTHIYLLFLFQIICTSIIEAYPRTVKVSMAHSILEDRLIFKQNKVIQTIWQQEPATACDIEKPPGKMLTDKHILQFNFVPYLCVILYDASLRYLELNSSHENTELNSGYAQEIIKGFSADNFCQKMKDHKWFTTIEENKFWVSNFSNDMKNKIACQRYCVSDVYVNPICAYTLWLDLSAKTMKHESSHPPLLNSEASHPLQPAGIPLKKEQTGTSIEKQDNKQVSDANLSVMESTRLNTSTENRWQLSGVPDEKHPSGTVTERQNSGMTLADGVQVPATAEQKQYFENSLLYPDHTNIKDSARVHVPEENNPKKSEPVQTEKTLATSNGGSWAVRPNLVRTSDPLEYPVRGNAPETHFSQALNQDFKPGKKFLPHSEHILDPNSVLTFNSSKPDIKNPQNETQNVKQSVSGPDHLVHTKPNGTTSSANPHQVASVLEGPTGSNIGSLPSVSEGEYNTEGQEQVSGDHRASANLVGYESENGGQVDTSNVASHGDSPKPSVPETPKIPVPSEEKSDEARVNTTVPENVTKEVPGSTLGGLTDTKPDLDHIGKSEPEAANQAIEGDAKVISGEPDDHEEQNAMDGSQVENGDPLADHGGDQTQDHDEAGLDMDQEFATESHRYNEGDNDEPSKPDGSTKLSDNNNNKDYIGSDEDEGPWPPGRIPINDAEGGYAHDRFVDAEDSHFFAYFMTMIVLCILGYLIFHNKQKILALALEGRVRKGSRRRPSTSGYRKLDSNLEEAVTSSCTGSSVTHVIY